MIERLWLHSSGTATLAVLLLLFSCMCFFMMCASSWHSAVARVLGAMFSFLALSAILVGIAKLVGRCIDTDRARTDELTVGS